MDIEHLDQDRLATRWAISPRTLERWRWTGQGPRFLKINGRIVYRLADVEAFEAIRLHDTTRILAVSSADTRIEIGAKPDTASEVYPSQGSSS